MEYAEVTNFNKNTDPIAVTITSFSLLKSADGIFRGRRRYNEPYIVSVAIDRAGDQTPQLSFNSMPFYNVREGDKVDMLGHGHLVFGPRNPGDFVATSVLWMESDQDVRDLGNTISEIVSSEEVMALRAAAAAINPVAGTVLNVLTPIADLIGRILARDSDDELARWDGVFLRDRPVPYDINRRFIRRNEFIEMQLDVVPLSQHNEQGPAPSTQPLA